VLRAIRKPELVMRCCRKAYIKSEFLGNVGVQNPLRTSHDKAIAS
jgi:hypothetical protein